MSGDLHILVADSPEGAGRDLSVELAEFPKGASVRRHAWNGDEQGLIEAARGADAILTDYVRITPGVIRELENCRLISIAATGYDAVDIAAAHAAGIAVCCVGEYCTDEVADHAMALMLALNRRLFDYRDQVENRLSWAWDEISGLRRLSGQTLGLVGYGRIGQAVARRALAFGLSVIAHDPYLDQAPGPNPVSLVTLPALLSSSDIISLHCNYDPGTGAIIDRSACDAMRRKPLLINVARGALVDETALVDALDSGQVSAAALDVLADEPPALKGHPLAGRGDVILTPHVAFYSEQALHQNRVISARNIRYFFEERVDEVFRLVT